MPQRYKWSFKNKLEVAINNAKRNPKNTKTRKENTFKKELSLFESRNIRTKNLDDLYYALLSLSTEVGLIV